MTTPSPGDDTVTILGSATEPAERATARAVLDAYEAQRALRETEERFHRAATAAHAVVYEVHLADGATAIVHGLREVFGYDPASEALSSAWWLERMHPEDLERHRAELDEQLADAKPRRVEYRVRHADARWVPVEDHRAVVLGAAGQPERLVGTILDVTERVAAEAAIRDREQRLRGALEAGELGAWSWQAEDGRVVWDDRVYAIYGVPPDQPAPGPAEFQEFLHPEERGVAELQWDLHSEPGTTYHEREFRIVRADGVERWVQSWETVEHDAAGQLHRIIGLSRDITERKEAEEALRRSEERLSIVANLAPTYVWVADAAGNITFTGERWLEYTGLSFEENRDWPERVLHPEDLERCVAAWSRAVETGTEYRIEVRNRRHDGTYRWMETRAVPVRDHRGVVTSWLGATTDIHERWVAEQRMRDDDERLRLALEVGNLGTFTVDPITRTLRWGERAQRILGVPPEQSSGAFIALLHPDDRARARTEILATWDPMAVAADHEGDYRIVRADGSVRWIYRRWRILFEGEGAERRAVRAVGTIQDVTERRIAEEALRERERQLRAALDAGGLGTWSFDMGSGVLTWDARMRELYGLAPHETPNPELLLERTHPADRRPPEELEALRDGTPERAEHEFRIVRPDGEIRWLQAVGRTEYDETGHPVRTAGFSRDITVRKRAEEALLERERRLQIALELGELGTITRDAGAAAMSMDARAREIYGLSPTEEARPEIILERTHPEDRERLREEQVRAWSPESDGFFEGLYRIVWPDGTVRWVNRRVLITFEGEGPNRRAVRGVATLRDMTEQRRLELAQQEFLAMASHELRNPLAALTGNAQLLLRRGAFDRESAEIIVAQAKHLERLVRDLLDVTTATAGQFQLRRAAVDLARLASEVASEQQATTRLHRVYVRRAPTSVRGIWDGDRLQQVIRNLVSNAIKYSPDGGEVAIDIETSEREVRLSVEDHGVGIAEEEQTRIFRRFYRSEPRTGRVEGLGLGLDVTRALVEAHGGGIGVTSTVGVGSTFTVKLPLESGFEAGAGTGTSADGGAATAAPTERRSRRVLVADDDPQIRRLLREAIGGEGHEVVTAVDGLEALELASRNDFDALLVDVMMPRLDGPGLVRALRSRGLAEGVPVILVSASHAARAIADDLEARAVVEKPFDLESLLTVLDGALADAP